MNIGVNILEQTIALVRKGYNSIESCAGRIRESKGKRRLLWTVVVLACFVALLVLNVLTPLISDDFAYLFIYGENAHITSVGDIVQSQVNHYYQWGGRSIVHFIAQVLLLLPSYVSDVLNTLVYLGYAFLIYYHIKGEGRSSISLFVLINLAVWFVQPVFGDTILWTTGSANYLWGTFLILLLLLPFRLYKGWAGKGVAVVLASAGLFLFGIVAGWTNENTAGAMILAIILFFFYYRSRRWQVPVWGVAALMGSIIGFAFMVLAPGNFERAGDSTSLSLFIFGYRLFNCTLTFFYYSGTFFLVCMILLVLYYRFPDRQDNFNLKYCIIYYIIAIAAVYAMLFSPTFPRRALFGVVTFLIIGAGILFYNLDYRNKFLWQIKTLVILVGLFCFVFTYYLVAKEINSFRNIMNEREVMIEAAKKKGAETCEFQRYPGSSYIHGEDPFSEELMSRYYGIKIVLKE